MFFILCSCAKLVVASSPELEGGMETNDVETDCMEMVDEIDQQRVYLNLRQEEKGVVKVYISRATDASRVLRLSAGSELTADVLQTIPLLRLERVQMDFLDFKRWREEQGLTPVEFAFRYALTPEQVLVYATD